MDNGNTASQKPKGHIPGSVPTIAQPAQQPDHLLMKAFMNAHDFLCYKDLSGKILLINATYATFLGFDSPEDARGKTLYDIYPDSIAKYEFDIEQQVINTGQPSHEQKTQIKSPAGIQKWVTVDRNPLVDEQGDICGLLFMARDITSLQHVEKELQAERELLNLLMESVPDTVYFKDLQSRFIRVNNAQVKALGAKNIEDVIGKSDFDFFDRKSAEAAYQDEQEIIRTGIPLVNKLERLLFSDNQWKWMTATKVPLKDGHGNIIGTAGISRDVTKAKEIEEALRKSQERYRFLFEKSKDVVFERTPEGEFVEINQAGLDLFCVKNLNELHKLNIRKMYGNPTNMDKIKVLMELQGYIKDFEYELTLPTGYTITILETSSAVKEESGDITAYRGIMRDVTQFRESDKKLRKMNKNLQRMNEKLTRTQSQMVHQEKLAGIGQLAAGVAHELNNPLGFLMGNNQILRDYFESLRKVLRLIDNGFNTIDKTKNLEEIYQDLRQIWDNEEIEFIIEDVEEIFRDSREGFRRMKEIVENLRRFSRVDRKHQIEEFDLNEAIQNTLVIARNEIKYVAEVETNLNPVPYIWTWGSEINQVLLNIFVNAAQAIKSQNRNETGKIMISTYAEGDIVCCDIADDGPGIPDELLTKVFNPFFTTKDAGEGTGLGLSISHDIIVNKNHGDLLVENIPDGGAIFRIHLPANSEQEENDRDETG